MVLIAVSVLMLALAIVSCNENGWTSSMTLLLFAGAAGSILALALTEARVEYPIIDLHFSATGPSPWGFWCDSPPALPLCR